MMRRRPRRVSHRLAIHTLPSSDRQLCRSKPATIVGLYVAISRKALAVKERGLTVSMDCIAAHKIDVVCLYTYKFYRRRRVLAVR